jgi:hypothetical protein
MIAKYEDYNCGTISMMKKRGLLQRRAIIPSQNQLEDLGPSSR